MSEDINPRDLEPCCENCAAWRSGECRYMPPVLISTGDDCTYSGWPNSARHEWCYRHMPMPIDPEDHPPTKVISS